jgi:hypothetical protein
VSDSAAFHKNALQSSVTVVPAGCPVLGIPSLSVLCRVPSSFLACALLLSILGDVFFRAVKSEVSLTSLVPNSSAMRKLACPPPARCDAAQTVGLQIWARDLSFHPVLAGRFSAAMV